MNILIFQTNFENREVARVRDILAQIPEILHLSMDLEGINKSLCIVSDSPYISTILIETLLHQAGYVCESASDFALPKTLN